MNSASAVPRTGCAFRLAFGALVLVAITASLAAAQTPDILDTVTLRYRNAATTWMDRLHPLALQSFVLLAGVEFAIAACLWVIHESEGMASLQAQFLRKFAFICFWYALLFTWEYWIPPLFNGFSFAGQTASGLPALNPSPIVDIGIDMSSRMLRASAAILLLDPVNGPLIVIAAFVTEVAFFAIAVAVCYTIIQGWLTMGAGVLFLGMAGWRSTAQMADNYLNTVIYIGIKLMTLYLLVGAAVQIGDDMVEAIAGANWLQPGPVFSCLVTAILLASLVVGLPVFFASRLTAGQSFGLINAIRAKDR